MIYIFLLRMSNAQYLMIWWCQHWPGMNQGSVGIDHLDPLVSWQDLMMNTAMIISMMTMTMMMTMIRRKRMMTKLNLNDDHLYSFLNHLSVRYLPNSSSWNITRFVKYLISIRRTLGKWMEINLFTSNFQQLNSNQKIFHKPSEKCHIQPPLYFALRFIWQFWDFLYKGFWFRKLPFKVLSPLLITIFDDASAGTFANSGIGTGRPQLYLRQCLVCCISILVRPSSLMH